MIGEVKTYLDYLYQRRYSEAFRIKNELGIKEILDVGCSHGYGALMLNAIGAYIDPGLLAEAKKKGLRVIRYDAHNLPFKQAAF